MDSVAIQSFLSLFLLGFVTSIAAKQLVLLSITLTWDRSGAGEWRVPGVSFLLSFVVLAFLLGAVVLPTTWKLMAILFGVIIATTPAILEGRALIKALKGR